MSKEADVIRAAEALKAIKALVEANQSVDDDVLTLDSVVWRAPNETVQDGDEGGAQSPEMDTALPLRSVVHAGANATSDVHYPTSTQTPQKPETVDDTPSRAPDQGAATRGPAIIAEPAPVLDEDPYAIFELDTPALTPALGTAAHISAELPSENARELARAAVREQRQARLEAAPERALAPSPVLQPTVERVLPTTPASESYADFSLDEHEAMMSTPMPTPIVEAGTADALGGTDHSGQGAPTNNGPQLAADIINSAAKTAPAPHDDAVVSAHNTDGAYQSDQALSSRSTPIATPTATPIATPTSAPAAGHQTPLHVVANNGVAEGDETNPQDVMRTALRSMIRDQIGNWLEDNINGLIEDALREPASDRTTQSSRKTSKNNNQID